MFTLLFIYWNVDPTAIEIGPVTFQWYGILFALGIVLAYQLMKKIYQKENIDSELLDYLAYFVVGGTIIGARLGHVFFYDWDYYSQNMMEIPMIWKGGLASHGGGIGILLALWVYSKYFLKKTFLWIADRVTIPTCLTSIFIRTGNLMNHEIIGDPTNVPWAFIFGLVDDQPRHPAQLYEAIAFFMIMVLLGYLYWKTKISEKQGFITGLFFVMVFTSRFLIEFVKNSQGGMEELMNNVISTGQLLSIPFILAGVALMVRSAKH